MTSTAFSAQGTTLQIGTGTGGAKTITAIALGFPTIVTSAAHALSNGNRGTLAAFTGANAATLNAATPNIENVTTNTFAFDIDTTGQTIVGTAASFTPITYTNVGNLKTVAGFDGEADEIDTTNLASAAKEYLLGITDEGKVTLGLDQKNADTGQAAMRAARAASSLQNFRMQFPDGTTATFSAFVKKFSTTLGVNQAVKADVDLRISGPVTWS